MIYSDELFKKNKYTETLATYISIQMNALVHLAEGFFGCKRWQAGETKGEWGRAEAAGSQSCGAWTSSVKNKDQARDNAERLTSCRALHRQSQ